MRFCEPKYRLLLVDRLRVTLGVDDGSGAVPRVIEGDGVGHERVGDRTALGRRVDGRSRWSSLRPVPILAMLPLSALPMLPVSILTILSFPVLTILLLWVVLVVVVARMVAVRIDAVKSLLRQHRQDALEHRFDTVELVLRIMASMVGVEDLPVYQLSSMGSRLNQKLTPPS